MVDLLYYPCCIFTAGYEMERCRFTHTTMHGMTYQVGSATTSGMHDPRNALYMQPPQVACDRPKDNEQACSDLKVAAGLQDVAKGFWVWRLNLELCGDQQHQHSRRLLPLLIGVVLELVPKITADAGQTANVRLRCSAGLVCPGGGGGQVTD